MEIKRRWQMFFLKLKIVSLTMSEVYVPARRICYRDRGLSNCLIGFTLLTGIFLATSPLTALVYHGPTVTAIDNSYKDESQKSLHFNFRNAIYGRNVVVIQPYYNNFGGNLTNFQVSVGLSALAPFSITALFPREFEAELVIAERRMVQVYESLLRRVLRMNPWPGIEYVLTVRSPAFPFIYLASIDELASDKKTFPFMDDERNKTEKIADRQFGIAFRLQF